MPKGRRGKSKVSVKTKAKVKPVRKGRNKLIEKIVYVRTEGSKQN